MSRHVMLGTFAVAFLCFELVALNAYAITPSASSKQANKQAQTKEQKDMQTKMATSDELGGKERYLTMVSTDKPIYRSGDKVYVRGVILNAADHKPLSSAQSCTATIEIKGPKGDVVATASSLAQDSVWGYAWDVPEGQAGGEYKIRVTYPWNGHAPAERKFDIRAYRAPRLNSQITFLRDGYSPGDKVSATLEVKRAEGGFPAGARVTVTANVDGEQISGADAKVDEKGLCTVSLDLPAQISRGEGTLALAIEDGGVVETASKTIPIILQTVDLNMFPEGGDLIAGFANRVYVQAKQPNGKPADLAGKIVSRTSGETATEFRTEHEGRGRFIFTPEADREYFLSVSEPTSIKTTYPLPKVKSSGAIIKSTKDVFESGQPVGLEVGCNVGKQARVTLSKKEVTVATSQIDSGKHLVPVSFNLPDSVDGVLTVTVWDQNNTPLAERLIFRRPAKPLQISITADQKTYVPGDNAKITVKATNSDGKPVSAVVGLTVTDESVLEMIDKREQAPRLPVMVFLEPEVQDLADAHVYLDANNPKAPVATDLLLGTQGWRRFCLMDVAKFIEANGDKARRVVALKIESPSEQRRAAEFFDFAAVPAAAAMPRGGMIPPANFGKAIVDGLAALKKAMPNAAPKPAFIAQGAPVLAEPMMQRQAAADKNVAKLEKAIMAADEEVGALGIAARRRPASSAPMIVVREFAHQVREGRKAGDRVDFSDTLFWNAGVKTDLGTGEATVSFGLNDAVTTFRVFADAFADTGSVGTSTIGVTSSQPFYAETKMPLEVTAGDQILLPINLVTSTNDKPIDASVNVDLKGDFKIAELQKNGERSVNQGNQGRVRWIQPIVVGAENGAVPFSLTAKAGVFEDKVTRSLLVKPKGFPIENSFGGMLNPNEVVAHTITIPPNTVTHSVSSHTAVYPTPLANLTEALQRMIQDPYGCFEQTCSTSYPLTMAQQYFLSHTGIEPKLIETSREKLDAGYKRLIGYWCPDKGYEWFGENPGHEALTAFGLLHFNDMSKVREVDQNMVNSTRAWLFKQKDGKGGFNRKRRALHTWVEDKDCSNAYILWALLETGQPASELKLEIDSLKSAATASQNSYVIALAANVMYLSGDKAEAKKLMDRLAAKQKPDGSIGGVTSSIVGSGGESLEVEGAALTTLAWLREPQYAANIEKSIKYLADSCKSGRYGSTQATVLALRSIVTYDKQRAKPKAPGKVRVYVDGQAVGDWVSFNQQTQGAIKLPDITELLTPGTHKLEVRMEGGSAMPYSLAVKYNAETPASSSECKLDIQQKIAQESLVEGTSTEAEVTVINKTKEVLPTPVAIVGLPGGLEPRHDQLKELVKKGTIDAYEVLGREVVLYWRTLPAEARVSVPISLIAAIPGTYTGPASRTYLYYTDEHKKWIDGVKVQISAK